MIKTWQERLELPEGALACYMQAEINELRAELDKLRQQEPVVTTHPNNLRDPREGPWCKSALLYSLDNKGDGPEKRVNLYLAAGASK